MKFRSENPDFNLTSAQLASPIWFEGGYYETNDLAEIKALQRHSAVEVVSESAPRVEAVSADPPVRPEVDEFALDDGELEEIEREEDLYLHREQ